MPRYLQPTTAGANKGHVCDAGSLISWKPRLPSVANNGWLDDVAAV